MPHINGFILRAEKVETSRAGNRYQRGIIQLVGGDLLEWCQFEKDGVFEEIEHESTQELVGKKDKDGTFIISFLRKKKEVKESGETKERHFTYTGDDAVDKKTPIDYIMDFRGGAWVTKVLREKFGSFEKMLQDWRAREQYRNWLTEQVKEIKELKELQEF